MERYTLISFKHHPSVSFASQTTSPKMEEVYGPKGNTSQPNFTRNKSLSILSITSVHSTTATSILMQNRLEPRICAPETIGALDGAYKYVIDYLEERGVHYRIEESTLN